MYAILADIHGNMYAFQNVLEDMKKFDIEGFILLGDLIDYGMQSNAVIDYLQDELKPDVLCNLWGNHEQAIIFENFTKFSSKRGVECAQYTASMLSDRTKEYLNTQLVKEGISEFKLDGKKCLAVHGSLEDFYWKAITPDNIYGDYSSYDIVFSGHSHFSHIFTKYYEAADPEMRNKRAVMFINPGSVGQPRNHNPKAQYALLDTKTMSVNLRAVSYDVNKAMALYNGSVNRFYMDRLKNGI